MADRRVLSGVVALAAMGVASALAHPDLPAEMVIRWDAAGNPSGTADRVVGLAGIPAVAAFVWVLFLVVPRIDPLRENIEAFRPHYDRLLAVVLGLLAYLHLLVLAWNLGHEFAIVSAISPAIAVLYYYVGTVLDHAERNWFVGIRTPWTLSDDGTWDRAHERGARLFRIAGVAALFGAFVPEYAVYLIVGPAVLVALDATLYSYLDYRWYVEGPKEPPG